MRIIFFSDFNKHTTPLFSKTKILKFIYFIQMENCIFVNKSVSGSFQPLFSQVYLFANDYCNHNTRFPSNGFLKNSTDNTFNTSVYGTKSLATLTRAFWNYFQPHFSGINFFQPN